MAVYHLSEAGQFVAALARAQRDAAMRGLLSAAVRMVAHIQAEIIPATTPLPVARGAYRAAWRAEKTHDGAVVRNDAPHAPFIEEGVRGENIKIGRQMIEALAAWVRMKGIGGSTGRDKAGRFVARRATLEEATNIAWAIAKAMQKKGIFNGGQGLGVMRRAREQIPRFVREEVLRELRSMSVRH